MSPRKTDWQVRHQLIDSCTDKRPVVIGGMADGWVVPRWAVTRFIDPSGTYPTVEARAEVRGKGGTLRLVVTSVTVIEDRRGLKGADLRALAPVMPDLAAEVLAPWTIKADGNRDAASVDTFVRAMNAALRGPSVSMIEREDECLRRWETEYQPAGMTQAEAAEAMGLRPSSFRSYLTHARARRGN